MKIYGFVLCAGFGKRLAPLTDHIPKPLLEVGGRSVLDYSLEKLFRAGVEKVGVNAHHLSSQLRKSVAESRYSDKLVFFDEDEILETGGGLVNAKSFLSECDSFVVHNGDILSDFDITPLIEKHLRNHNTATLATLAGPENRVLCDSDGNVLDMRGVLGAKGGAKSYMTTFSGIAVYTKKIFDYLPESPCRISVVDGLLEAIRKSPCSVGTYPMPEGCLWTDIGNVKQYFEANMRWTGNKVSVSSSAVVEEGALLEKCVLLPGAHVRTGERRSNEIIGNGFSCNADYAELSELGIIDMSQEVTTLAQQGSARRFYKSGADTALMISNASDADFTRFIELGRFFEKHSLHTPAIYKVNEEKYAVSMEFLGFDMLYAKLLETTTDSERYSLYAKVIDTLADYQKRGTRLIAEESFSGVRKFDYDYLRWETSYFRENLLENFCGMSFCTPERARLDEEFDSLAKSCLAMPQTLMHRDFQSQNIMLHEGKVRFVDFQGARTGAYVYDIMSLVKDPYYPVSSELRGMLLEYHRQVLTPERPSEVYLRDALHASLQRNMQCLGAYGFLWLVKGKARYSSFIKPALELLADALKQTDEFPVLASKTR